MDLPDDFVLPRPKTRKPDCEYTAPGSTTEGIDCWVKAQFRHVEPSEDLNEPDTTRAVFCAKHSEMSLVEGRYVEEIIYSEDY